MSYPLITICGSYHLTKEWVKPCFESWKKIQNIDVSKFYVLSDTFVSDKDVETFGELEFKFLGHKYDDKVKEFLIDYPYLAKIREVELFWKKILDISILFSEHEKVVYIDTDVLINHLIHLPEGDFDIAYMREDIPAYHANWRLAWNEKMVPALQGGLIIFKPSIIDFSFLEHLAKNYFINCKVTWWTEQAAWACIAGKTEKRFLFSGRQVRAISGICKRSYKEILENKYKYFGRNKLMKDFSEVRPLIEGSSILHFAGMGKKWFLQAKQYLDQHNIDHFDNLIDIEHEGTLSLKDKILISSRLFFKETW